MAEVYVLGPGSLFLLAYDFENGSTVFRALT